MANTTNNNNDSNGGLYFIVGGLLVAVIAFGAYFYTNGGMSNATNGNSAVEKIAPAAGDGPDINVNIKKDQE